MGWDWVGGVGEGWDGFNGGEGEKDEGDERMDDGGGEKLGVADYWLFMSIICPLEGLLNGYDRYQRVIDQVSDKTIAMGVCCEGILGRGWWGRVAGANAHLTPAMRHFLDQRFNMVSPNRFGLKYWFLWEG